MTDAPHVSTRSREEIIRLNGLGRQWLQAFFSALRTSQFHDADNRIFDDLVGILVRKGNDIIEREARADFQLLEDNFFLNGLWIKPTLAERENIFQLASLLRHLGLGGVIVRAPTAEPHWRSFLRIHQSHQGAVEDRPAAVNRALAAAAIEQIELHRTLRRRQEPPDSLLLPPVAYTAVTGYVKLLLALREFARAAPGEEQVTVLRKAQRVICELNDLYEKSPRLFAVLSLLKNFDTHFIHHGVNVLILSLLSAREIGIARRKLVDLGMAALFHDAGKLMLPEEILTKPGGPTARERERIERHPIDSATAFLTLGYLTESVAERVLVAYQHHWAWRAPDAQPKPRRPMTPSLFSEIVAVCVRYDSLTSAGEPRGGYLPWQALRIMASEVESGRFRREVFHAFLRLMGPFPVGSWLLFDDGREGLVAAGGALAPSPPSPLVYFPRAAPASRWLDCGSAQTGRSLEGRFHAGSPPPEGAGRALGELFRNSEDSPLA